MWVSQSGSKTSILARTPGLPKGSVNPLRSPFRCKNSPLIKCSTRGSVHRLRKGRTSRISIQAWLTAFARVHRLKEGRWSHLDLILYLPSSLEIQMTSYKQVSERISALRTRWVNRPNTEWKMSSNMLQIGVVPSRIFSPNSSGWMLSLRLITLASNGKLILVLILQVIEKIHENLLWTRG